VGFPVLPHAHRSSKEVIMEKLSQFEIDLAKDLFGEGFDAFVQDKPYEQTAPRSWSAGWRHARDLYSRPWSFHEEELMSVTRNQEKPVYEIADIINEAFWKYGIDFDDCVGSQSVEYWVRLNGREIRFFIQCEEEDDAEHSSAD
jgi:hypothetical protein